MDNYIPKSKQNTQIYKTLGFQAFLSWSASQWYGLSGDDQICLANFLSFCLKTYNNNDNNNDNSNNDNVDEPKISVFLRYMFR